MPQKGPLCRNVWGHLVHTQHLEGRNQIWKHCLQCQARQRVSLIKVERMLR